MDLGGSTKKKKGGRGRSGSFGGDGRQDLEESDEDIAFEDLDANEKYQVLQHLYEEYQRDPDNFPEDQRILLEQELKDLFENQQEEDDLSDQAPGVINFPDQPLPGRDDDDKQDDEDEEEVYMQEIIKQQEEAQKERLRQQEELEDEDEPDQAQMDDQDDQDDV